MALASAAAANAALDAILDLADYVSLHTATTSTTGAAETSGGSYIRKACSWNAASGSSATNSSALTFATAGSVAITHIGTWSAETEGTFYIGAALGSSVTAAAITIAAGAITFSAS